MADETTTPSSTPSNTDSAGDMAQAALLAAEQAVAGLSSGLGITATDGAMPMPLPNFAASLTPGKQKAIELLSNVNLNVKIELGRTRMLIEDVLQLNEGSVVELDKLAGDPVDIFVNERHIARGEVLVLNDNFCVRISEVLQAVGEVAAATAKPI